MREPGYLIEDSCASRYLDINYLTMKVRAGLTAPEFEDKGHSFVVTLYQQFEDKTREATVSFDEINDRQKKALELAEEGTVRTNDLAEIFNEVETRTIRRDLRDLVKRGLLEAKGMLMKLELDGLLSIINCGFREKETT